MSAEQTDDPGRILVVDDEDMVREVIARYLERDGFRVDTAADGHRAMALLEERTPDLAVLDIMLPGIDGLELLRACRRAGSLPVILLTARGEEVDRILGLELGADDYVVKPFSPRELVARVRSVLRRAQAARDPTASQGRMSFGGLDINPATREVTIDGELVDLTPKEFDLLAYLAAAPRQVFSRAQLLTAVWNSSPDWQEESTVTVHVGRLRHKLERDPHRPQRIATVWGVGYRFQP